MQEINASSLAFSLYASMAATIAVSVLQRDGKISDLNVEQLAESLEACREFVGDNAALKAHADLLEDILKSR